MDWVTILLAVGLGLGVAAGTMLIVRSPAFWMGLGSAIVKAVMPAIMAAVLKRMPPKDEEAYRDCVRRAGRWNHRTRRCE